MSTLYATFSVDLFHKITEIYKDNAAYSRLLCRDEKAKPQKVLKSETTEEISMQ